MLSLDGVDEKVAQVSGHSVETDDKIGDLQRRELATFKEEFAETYGALHYAWPSAATVFWEVSRVCASGWRTALHAHIAILIMQPLCFCGDWMDLLI